MQSRPLRDFERGAHLHVLDWAHQTARYRFGAAGQVQVKAAAKAVAKFPNAETPPELPSLEAALTDELRKLYALGHATVRSELDHQATGDALPIGLSAAPAPPNLRRAKSKKGKHPDCASCKMFDAGARVCWGYGNYPVKPNQLCDSYAPEQKAKALATDDQQRDPGRLRARARVAAASVAHLIWEAILRARLQGITDPKRLRQIGREAGAAGLKQAASHHAGGAINAGRHAAATIHTGTGTQQVIGARYTSVLDKSSCAECVAADDGVLRALDDPALIHPPNPACAGGDRCRCILVYQLSTEVGSKPVPVAASR